MDRNQQGILRYIGGIAGVEVGKFLADLRPATASMTFQKRIEA